MREPLDRPATPLRRRLPHKARPHFVALVAALLTLAMAGLEPAAGQDPSRFEEFVASSGDVALTGAKVIDGNTRSASASFATFTLKV